MMNRRSFFAAALFGTPVVALKVAAALPPSTSTTMAHILPLELGRGRPTMADIMLFAAPAA